MTRILTSEAKKTVLDNPSLYADICMFLNVKAGSLSQMIYRNSPQMISHDVVCMISNITGKQPQDLLQWKNPGSKSKVKSKKLNPSV